MYGKTTNNESPADSLLKSVSRAINSANYSLIGGAIYLSKCLNVSHFDKDVVHPKLQIIASQMNAYYSAIGYFKAKGGLYNFIALWYLFNAKKLAHEYLLFLNKNSLAVSEHKEVGVLQQCQASYWGWAILKRKIGLRIDHEKYIVVDLYNNIRDNKSSGHSIIALASAVICKFPPSRMDVDVWCEAFQKVKKEIEYLKKKKTLSKEESQVLSRLLRATNKHEEAEVISSQAGLVDQVIKAKAGI